MPLDRSQYRTLESEPQDDWGFIQDVVAPPPVAAPAPAPVAPPAPFNPVGFDWANKGMQNIGGIIYAPQYSGATGSMEQGDWMPGELQGIMRYKEGATGPGQSYEIIDPATGQVTGTGKFKEQSRGFFGDLFGMVSQAAADLAPVLQFTPLGPAVAAINAVNAARTGDVLPAIASVAGFGGYNDIANAAKAASAIKNEDYLGAILPGLNAAGITDVGGFNTKDIGNAVNVARAIQNENPLALLSAAAKYAPATQASAAEMTSFFPEFDQPLLTAEPPAPTPITAPERMVFLEANIEDPATIEGLMQQYYPEIYTPAPVDNETAKLLRQQELAQAGESPLGGMGPGAKELPLINLSGTSASKPAAPKGPAFDPNLLFALSAIMGQQQPQKQDPYQVAQIRNLGPMDLLV